MLARRIALLDYGANGIRNEENMETTKCIWFDGKLVPWEEARVHVLTHSLHYGSAVFEGIRAYACEDGTSAIFRLPAHCRRLVNSAKIMRLNLPYSAKDLEKACLEVSEANDLIKGYIRPLAFVGYGEMGVYPGSNPVQTIIACWPWGVYLGAEALEKGISVKISTFTRSHINANMTKAKSAGNYVNSILAKIEAKEDGYDEAIMLDAAGYVSEATGENLFIVRDGVIKTPPVATILEGITRDSVIVMARNLGYTVLEQPITRDEIYVADEVFLCGTAAEITPVREVDHRVIGAGRRGPVTKRLQETFFEAATGRLPQYSDWLTHYEVKKA